MKAQKMLFLCIYFLITCVVFMGFSEQSHSAEIKSKLVEVLDRGSVIVGTSNAYPPFGFLNEKNELVGYDVDIAKLLAKAIFRDESKVEFVIQGFDARWANVESGKIDVGIMASTIYPERALKVAFTRPYLDSGIAVIVRKDSKIKTLSDLNNEKCSIANLTNPQMQERAKKHVPKAKVLVVESGSAQVLAVTSGRSTAAQLELAQALYVSQTTPGVRVLTDLMSEVQAICLYLRQDDFRWWLFLDTFVFEITSGNLYEDYKTIYKKWFGVAPPPPRSYGLVRPGK